MEQSPTVGRIVIYNHPGSADGTFKPTQSPAIIQKVELNDEKKRVDLWVFGPNGLHKNNGTVQGDGPCQWNWPKREDLAGIREAIGPQGGTGESTHR